MSILLIFHTFHEQTTTNKIEKNLIQQSLNRDDDFLIVGFSKET